VSLHARRWGLSLFRETQDADFGVPQLALNTVDVVPAFDALGYNRVRSNRFAKSIAAAVEDKDWHAEDGQALVDILVPALTSHPRKRVEVGGVTTIEVPGLAEALSCRRPKRLPRPRPALRWLATARTEVKRASAG
jgi:hypothetical protein